MPLYKKPQTEADYHLNFAQKKPLMNATEAFSESARCLFCYDAPCMHACPTHIDIPLFIKQIHTGNVDGAAATIYDSNWMGNACGKVCPTQVLCEGACVYNNAHVKPIEIGRLQNYATRQAIESASPLFSRGTPNGRKVAVIGAGPAGLSCAAELSVLGYAVDVFEALDRPSGLTVHGTAPYKITNEEALAEVEYLQQQLGFAIHYGVAIGTEAQLRELEAGYDAIFLGVGLGPTAALHVPGEEQEGVIGAVEFVRALRFEKHRMPVPRRVVVLGGGNTAMDAASEAARMGAEDVYLVYRRDREAMGAYSFEFDLAVSAGVRPVFHATPVEILGEGVATGVRFAQSVGHSSVGHTSVGHTSRARETFTIDCDLVIKATGQARLAGLLQMIPGLELDAARRIVVDPVTFQTGNPKYFAGGDAVNGGAEVVNGAYEGKRAARGIHQAILDKMTEINYAI